jgi:cytochrome c oxidase subunit 2
MKVSFNDSSSPLMEQLLFFHDWSIIFISRIAMGALLLLSMLYIKKASCRSIEDSQRVEFIWTLLPCIILLFVGFPSLRLLYMVDEIGDPSLTFKMIGHQWYWSYEYSDFKDLDFDSYMENGPYRLLDSDHRLVLPSSLPLRGLTTSADVLHSWTIPALGTKADAAPGRLNQLSIMSDRSGVLYGQCREICGTNHSFIPIVAEFIPSNIFSGLIT